MYYIIKLKNGRYYAGFSSNLKNRINEHRLGKVTSTKDEVFSELIYYCAFKSKYTAIDFEKYLKTNSGFAFRNKRLV